MLHHTSSAKTATVETELRYAAEMNSCTPSVFTYMLIQARGLCSQLCSVSFSCNFVFFPHPYSLKRASTWNHHRLPTKNQFTVSAWCNTCLSVQLLLPISQLIHSSTPARCLNVYANVSLYFQTRDILTYTVFLHGNKTVTHYGPIWDKNLYRSVNLTYTPFMNTLASFSSFDPNCWTSELCMKTRKNNSRGGGGRERKRDGW